MSTYIRYDLIMLPDSCNFELVSSAQQVNGQEHLDIYRDLLAVMFLLCQNKKFLILNSYTVCLLLLCEQFN